MRGRFLFIFLLLLLAELLAAQISSPRPYDGRRYYGFGAEIGLTSFFGDIDEGPADGNAIKNNLAYKLSVGRTFNSQVKLSGSLTFGHMSGDKERGTNGSTYHWYFKNSFIEYTFNCAVNFMAFFSKNGKSRIMIFGGLGIGLIDFKTTLYNGIDNSVIQSFGKDGEKSTTEFVLPLRFEVLFHLNSKSAAFIQTTSSRVDSDKLDGMAGNNNRDYYNYLSVGYLYKIPISKKRGPLLKGAK